MKSLRTASLSGKRVLIRLDLDVPLDKKGHVKDDTRLRESLDTLRYLSRAKQVIIIGNITLLFKPFQHSHPHFSALIGVNIILISLLFEMNVLSLFEF